MAAKSFGRDDLNALLGGAGGSSSGGNSNIDGTEDMVAFRPSMVGNPQQKRIGANHTTKQDVDLSKLSASETATLLLEKKVKVGNIYGIGGGQHPSGRYRTKKVLAHHQIIGELAQEMSTITDESKLQQQQPHLSEGTKPQNRNRNDGGSSSSDDDDVNEKNFTRTGRKPIEASVIIRRRHDDRTIEEETSRSRRSRTYNSSSANSSSSSNDDGGKNSDASRRERTGRRHSRARDTRRKRGGSSSSSSGSDTADDRRKRRILSARTAQQEPEVVVPISRSQNEKKVERDEEGVMAVTLELKGNPDANLQPTKRDAVEAPRGKATKTLKARSSSDDSSDSNDSSSSDGSSDSSSSDSEDSRVVLTKAVFVPRHKRMLVQSDEKKWEEEENLAQREKEREKKRIMESRALVAKQLDGAESSVLEDDIDEEAGGATNAPPNDDDDIDPEKERDAWELRELNRLLKAMDEADERQRLEDEYNRRKKMTDAECLEEDKRMGLYQPPGANRQSGDQSTKGNFMQRFYHRGAYYMDDSEWTEGDIRRKAAEYAKAATGEDKFDKSKLPEVMQVKNFGHARQNTRYKGLAKEDTTDKSVKILPLVYGRNKANK